MAIEMTANGHSKVRRRVANVRWCPATLAAFREADKFEADLAARVRVSYVCKSLLITA